MEKDQQYQEYLLKTLLFSVIHFKNLKLQSCQLDVQKVKIIYFMINLQMELWDLDLEKVNINISYILASFIPLLYKKGVINHKSFSLCLANNGGYFSVGGVNKTNHLEDIQYINFIKGSYYKVQLNNILINKNNIAIPKDPYFTIIDSGTTVSYFPNKIYNDLIKRTNEYCSKLNKCLGDNFTHKDFGSCYKVKDNISTTQFIESMPEYMFEFEDGVKYKWTADSYLFNITDPDSHDPRLTYCLGYVGWGSSEILLGSTWMHNHDIVFDIQNSKIGLASSDCSSTRIATELPIKKMDTPINTNTETTCKNKEQMYIFAIIGLCAFFMIIIILLLMGISRMKKGEKFLWMKLSDESILFI